jgi:hypothetical protein
MTALLTLFFAWSLFALGYAFGVIEERKRWEARQAGHNSTTTYTKTVAT